MNELEASLAAMAERLDRNIEIATRDPERVINGNFKGTSRSGLVTVWVDVLGRVERVNLARGSVREGDEQLLIDEFMSANENARRNAEELDFDGGSANTARPVPRAAEPDDDEFGGRILRPYR